MNEEDRLVLSDYIKEAGFPEEWAEEIIHPQIEFKNIYRYIDKNKDVYYLQLSTSTTSPDYSRAELVLTACVPPKLP